MPYLEDFLSRRFISLPTPRFQSRHTATPLNSASDAFELHPDVRRFERNDPTLRRAEKYARRWRHVVLGARQRRRWVPDGGGGVGCGAATTRTTTAGDRAYAPRLVPAVVLKPPPPPPASADADASQSSPSSWPSLSTSSPSPSRTAAVVVVRALHGGAAAAAPAPAAAAPTACAFDAAFARMTTATATPAAAPAASPVAPSPSPSPSSGYPADLNPFMNPALLALTPGSVSSGGDGGATVDVPSSPHTSGSSPSTVLATNDAPPTTSSDGQTSSSSQTSLTPERLDSCERVIAEYEKLRIASARVATELDALRGGWGSDAERARIATLTATAAALKRRRRALLPRVRAAVGALGEARDDLASVASTGVDRRRLEARI